MSDIIINDRKFGNWDDIHEEWMKDPEYRAGYEALEDEFRLIEMMIKLRQEKKLTQAQLAEKTGMKQAAIARLESGRANPSFKTLNRVAKAFGKKVTLA